MAAGRPSCRQRRQEAGDLGGRQGSLEKWRVGGREAQSQAGRPGLGWRLGSREAQPQAGKQGSSVTGWEVWHLSWKPGGRRGRQGGPGALSVVLKRGPAGRTVPGTAPPHGTPVGTSKAACRAVLGKATHDLTACWRTADTKNTHPQSLASLQTRLPTAPGEDKPLALTGSLVNIPTVSCIRHNSQLIPSQIQMRGGGWWETPPPCPVF